MIVCIPCFLFFIFCTVVKSVSNDFDVLQLFSSVCFVQGGLFHFYWFILVHVVIICVCMRSCAEFLWGLIPAKNKDLVLFDRHGYRSGLVCFVVAVTTAVCVCVYGQTHTSIIFYNFIQG